MQVKSIAEFAKICLIFIKLPIVIKIFVLSIFEWPSYTGFNTTCPHLKNSVDPNQLASDSTLLKITNCTLLVKHAVTWKIVPDNMSHLASKII